MRIHPLPAQLVNQIAAGEVIERPASVLKELLENSIDAGATAIQVDVEKGGVRRIRVRDDGSGMTREELPVALARHATSKIATVEDLSAISSLGFRGEALPSIASVSRLELQSGDAEGQAWRLAVEGGVMGNCEPVAHPQGTTVTVDDLFYNLPARRKFLRAERTEFRHVEQLFCRVALSRPGIAFRLKHNGRTLHDLTLANSREEQEQRVAAICGDAFMAHALHVDHDEDGFRLRGWLAQPGFSRSQADLQFCFVNGRMVRDRLVTHAFRQGYSGLLHTSRQPAYVMFFDLNPRAVDVNAHPAKHEVRFRNSGAVHDFLARVTHHVLEHAGKGQDDAHRLGPEALLGVTPAAPSSTATDEAPSAAWASGSGRLPLGPGTVGGRANAATRTLYQSVGEDVASVAGLGGAPAPAQGEHSGPLGHARAQIHGVYILAENDDGLVIVDMHAAHERIVLERMKREAESGELRQQALLVPLRLSVSRDEADEAEKQAEFLARLGFEVDRSGPQSLVIRSVPALLAESDCEQLVRDVLSDCREHGTSGVSRVGDAIEHIMGNMACRSAIRAGRRMTVPEMDALLREMETTDRAGHCNHGRPTWVSVDMGALDRLFLRGR